MLLWILKAIYTIWPSCMIGAYWRLLRWYCLKWVANHQHQRGSGVDRHFVVSATFGLDYIIYSYRHGEVAIGQPWMLVAGILAPLCQEPGKAQEFAFISHVWVGNSPVRDPYGSISKLLYIQKQCARHKLKYFWFDCMCCPQSAKPLKGGGHLIPHNTPISGDPILEYLSEIGLIITESKRIIIVDSVELDTAGNPLSAADQALFHCPTLMSTLEGQLETFSDLRGRETVTSMTVCRYLFKQLKQLIQECNEDGFECGGLYCTRMWTYAERAAAARHNIPTQMDELFNDLTSCIRGMSKLLYLVKVDILEAIRKEDFHIYTLEQHNEWLSLITQTDSVLNRLKGVLSYGVNATLPELDERAIKVFGERPEDASHLSRWRRSWLYHLMAQAYTHEISSSEDFTYAMMTSMHGLPIDFGETGRQWFEKMDLEDKILLIQASTVCGSAHPRSELHSTFGDSLLKNWPLTSDTISQKQVDEAVSAIHFRVVLAAFEDSFWPAHFYRSTSERDNKFLIVLQRTRSYVGFCIENSNLCLHGPAVRSGDKPIQVSCQQGVGTFSCGHEWEECTGVDGANFSRKVSQEPNSTGEDLLAAKMI